MCQVIKLHGTYISVLSLENLHCQYAPLKCPTLLIFKTTQRLHRTISGWHRSPICMLLCYLCHFLTLSAVSVYMWVCSGAPWMLCEQRLLIHPYSLGSSTRPGTGHYPTCSWEVEGMGMLWRWAEQTWLFPRTDELRSRALGVWSHG